MTTIFPKLTKKDIIPPPAKEYEEGEKKSTVGWLKHLFLLNQSDDLISITAENRREYDRVVKEFRRLNNIPKGISLEDWEDSASLVEQIKALNKLRGFLNKNEKGI